MARVWSCGPRICANPRSAPRRREPRPSRRGWGAVAAYMPNGWPRWLPFIPSSPLCACQKRSCRIAPRCGRRGPRGHGPKHKRVWASLAQSPEAVIREMFDEAARRDPKGQKRWVALVDGNLPQIDHLQRMAKERNIPLIIVVDFIHVAQYVWKAAGAFFPNQELEADRWARGRLLEILRGKASLVAAGMRRSATLREMAAAERKPVDDCADY